MQHVPPVTQQPVAQMSASGIKFRPVRAADARAPSIIYTVLLTQSVLPIVTLELHFPLCLPSSDVTIFCRTGGRFNGPEGRSTCRFYDVGQSTLSCLLFLGLFARSPMHDYMLQLVRRGTRTPSIVQESNNGIG